MPSFELTVLGSSSALPAAGRHPSAHVLNVHEHFYLIDCGEGTQMQLRKFRMKLVKIEAVFITHLHGDHYFGLPGLLGTLHLLGRTKPLQVFAPAGLKEIIHLQHQHSDTYLQFPLQIHEVDVKKNGIIYEDEKVSVSSFPMKHRIPCAGYRFEEKPWRDRVPRSFGYCSDTKKDSTLSSYIKGVDLLFHEATFMEEHRDKAEKTYHSTARDAAQIALESGVKRLLLGHFSARYPDVNGLLSEAKEIFTEVEAAEEGKTYPVKM